MARARHPHGRRPADAREVLAGNAARRGAALGRRRGGRPRARTRPARARLEAIRHVVQRFNKLVAFAIAAWLFARLRRLGLDDARRGGRRPRPPLRQPSRPSFEGFLLRTPLDAHRLRGARAARGRPGAYADAATSRSSAATALAIPLNPLARARPLPDGSGALAATIPSKDHSAARGAGLVLVGCAFGASGRALGESPPPRLVPRLRLRERRIHGSFPRGLPRPARLAGPRRVLLPAALLRRRLPPPAPRPRGRPSFRSFGNHLRRPPRPRVREVARVARDDVLGAALPPAALDPRSRVLRARVAGVPAPGGARGPGRSPRPLGSRRTRRASASASCRFARASCRTRRASRATGTGRGSRSRPGSTGATSPRCSPTARPPWRPGRSPSSRRSSRSRARGRSRRGISPPGPAPR